MMPNGLFLWTGRKGSAGRAAGFLNISSSSLRVGRLPPIMTAWSLKRTMLHTSSGDYTSPDVNLKATASATDPSKYSC